MCARMSGSDGNRYNDFLMRARGLFTTNCCVLWLHHIPATFRAHARCWPRSRGLRLRSYATGRSAFICCRHRHRARHFHRPSNQLCAGVRYSHAHCIFLGHRTFDVLPYRIALEHGAHCRRIRRLTYVKAVQILRWHTLANDGIYACCWRALPQPTLQLI